MQAENGGSDDGAIIYYTYVGQNEHLAGVGRFTTVMQARAIFRTKTPINPRIDVTADYEIVLDTYPDASIADNDGDLWDTGLWDSAVWDDATQYYTVRWGWTSVNRSGFAHAPVLHGDMLFLRRFDRALAPGGGVQRLHQESLASLVGQRGSGVAQSQQALLAGLRRVVTDPARETLEFIKRDVLNLALRNTDNHARNTAVQRTPEGIVQLTPLFDFAPMFRDPEVVPRSCHWRDKAGVRQADWRQVIEQLEVPDPERTAIAAEMAEFAQVVARLDVIALDCGVESDVISACAKAIETQARQLADLAGIAHG